MIAAALVFFVAGATPPARVLVLELEAVGVDKDVARAVDPIVLNAASQTGAEVIAQSDIKTIAAVEAEKAQLGCDSSSCLAELAGAMGAQLVLFGSVSRLGDTTTVALSLYDNAKSVVTRDSIAVDDVGALPKALPQHVKDLVARARGASSAAATTEAKAQAQEPADVGSPLLYAGIAGVVLGGTALLGGGVLATINELAVDDPSTLAATKRAAQETGVVGLGLAGIGLVVAGAGVVALVLE